MTSDAGHVFMSLLAICTFSLVKHLFKFTDSLTYSFFIVGL